MLVNWPERFFCNSVVRRLIQRRQAEQLRSMRPMAPGGDVLEIGCGEGRLTWQYAQGTRKTVGIDPDLDALRIANVDRPVDLKEKACFARADSQHLPFPKERFDLAVLAWSL